MHMQDVNWVDWGILSLIGISLLMGLWRGFVRETLSLITWIVALWMGVAYCGILAEVFHPIPMVVLRYVLSFILLVLVGLISGGILSYLIARLITFTGFGVTDKIMGALLGLARGVLVVAVGVMMVLPTPLIKDPLWIKSSFAPRFVPLASVIQNHVSPIIDWIKNRVPEEVLKKSGLAKTSETYETS